METIEIILLGYAVLIAYLGWELMEFQRILEHHKDILQEIIDKHNHLADATAEVLEALESLDNDLAVIEEKVND